MSLGVYNNLNEETIGQGSVWNCLVKFGSVALLDEVNYWRQGLRIKKASNQFHLTFSAL